jgi:hypothetical protein
MRRPPTFPSRSWKRQSSGLRPAIFIDAVGNRQQSSFLGASDERPFFG